MRAIQKRLTDLESALIPNEGRHVVFTEVVGGEDEDYKKSSDYLINRCLSSCPDKALYQRALENAFLSVTGTNPFDKQGVAFIIINTEVSLEVVENLREQGLEVAL